MAVAAALEFLALARPVAGEPLEFQAVMVAAVAAVEVVAVVGAEILSLMAEVAVPMVAAVAQAVARAFLGPEAEAVAAQSVLFGPVVPVHSRQPIRAICDGTFHSHR